MERETSILTIHGNHFEGYRKMRIWIGKEEIEAGKEWVSDYAEWDNGDFARVLVMTCAEPPGEIPF